MGGMVIIWGIWGMCVCVFMAVTARLLENEMKMKKVSREETKGSQTHSTHVTSVYCVDYSHQKRSQLHVHCWQRQHDSFHCCKIEQKRQR